ncbi:MAG TPA: DUF4442 domain-containing protein [Saprospiraceae bacterium]|nr:DUF4442 domain-containing protein [Saprospiraceae bacterium]MCB9327785.1 DUF4442 domain-containing protein [Lewinellaceae bacterium]HPK09568.1 DUF4442 domain-containing protein [Saprospiraceae bacterium]HPQ21239.1 DUF4442 domain-containing protein [Saprospiraceae bacterium]HRX29373.1 DUF4442 domain-containing protein [Saprospiraceae bacterium]
MNSEVYRKNITNTFKFKFFGFLHLPSVWFWGIRVTEFSKGASEVVIRHNYFNKNPFGSIYFSALMGAAELSTGILIQQYVVERNDCSMLVVNSHAEFMKKAIGKITFHCTQGNEVFETLINMTEGDKSTIILHSIGTDEDGDTIMKAEFTWSLKKRKK